MFNFWLRQKVSNCYLWQTKNLVMNVRSIIYFRKKNALEFRSKSLFALLSLAWSGSSLYSISFCCIKIMKLSFLVHDFILFFGITTISTESLYWDKRNGISFWVSPRKWPFLKMAVIFFVKRFQSFRANNATVFVSRA